MLKIKNIRSYRTYFKEKVRRHTNNSRDEHLLPPFHQENGEKTFGWFEIYYGDSEGFGDAETGIRSKLLSFLRMAKDGQAVYEFLQNAVDECSEHFSMIWGKDKLDGKQYLLVANNGRMFTKDNVRSILNIGGSTKTANHRNIGKFGIGFKLAHRLVGADDGLEELISDYCGPVLFSWQNNEIEQLAKGTKVSPEDVDYDTQPVGGHPWLFKILLTCFPCLPENEMVAEYPRLMDGKQTEQHLFPQSELEALSRWTQKLLDKVGDVSYKEGSLFFMQLGKGKDQELYDRNLEEGVKFFMGVLRETGNGIQQGNKGLQTVQLNGGRTITLPELEYERFTIDNIDPAYSNIFEGQSLSELKKIQHIDFLLGFRRYEKIDRFFHGAPNFYLFFPLSEEVHQFNFILHCNAFDNSSSRTFLQSGKNGRNEKLLKALVLHIKNRLKALSSNDTKRFLDLYAALLTSGSSKSANREWINKQFTYPLNDFLKTLIPVQEPGNEVQMTLLQEGQKAYIKNTSVEIDLEAWALDHVRWFYWEGKEYRDFTEKAIFKLELKPFGIYDLLATSGINQHLNTWMAAEKGRTPVVLRELDSQPIPKDQAHVVENLMDLDILEFSDGEVFSFNRLDEAQEQGYLLIHNRLSDIREILLKVGFKTTLHDFSDSQLLDALRNNVKNTSQLKSYTELVKLFNHTISEEAINLLTPEEKFNVYEAFRNLNVKHRPDRMAELKLFKNKNGQLVYLKNLLHDTDKKWLEPYTLHPDEAHLKLDYTVQKIEEVYPQIIHSFWPDIANRIAATPGMAPQVLDGLKVFYEKAKQQPQLEEQLVFFNGNAESHPRIFFHPDLADSSEYEEWQRLLQQYFGIVMPDTWFVPYLSQEPFDRDSLTLALELKDKISLTKDQLWSLLEMASTSEVDFYKNLLVSEQEGSFEIAPATTRHNCYTHNEKLASYVARYHADEWQPLSLDFEQAPELPKTKNEQLTQWLMDHAPQEEEARLRLTQALLGEDRDTQFQWAQKLVSIQLDTTWKQAEQNEAYLKLLAHLSEMNRPELLPPLVDKLILTHSEGTIPMKEIQQADDKLELTKGEEIYTLSLSKVLNTDNQEEMRIIRDFAAETVKCGLLNDEQADTLFKRAKSQEPQLEIFKQSLDQKRLINAHQLAFVVLSEQIPVEEVAKYQIMAADDDWYYFENNCYLPVSPAKEVLHLSYVLHEQYEGLAELLNTGDLNPVSFGSDETDLLLNRFLFQEGCHPNIFADGTALENKLNYLFESWNITGRSRTDKTQEDWQSALGFNPKTYVIHPLSLEQEQLPQEVQDWWAGDIEKTSFLAALGFQTVESPVIRLREYLLDASKSFDHSQLTAIDEYFLMNTLEGLAKGFGSASQPQLLDGDDDRIALMRKIQEHLAQRNEPDFCVLVHQPGGQFILVDPSETKVFRLDSELHTQLQQTQNHLNELYQAAHVWYHHEPLLESVGSQLAEPDYLTEVVREGMKEIGGPHYSEWSERNCIQLLMAEQQREKISAKLDEKTLYLGTIKGKDWYEEKVGEGNVAIYFLKRLGLEGLLAQLKEVQNPHALAVEQFVRQREEDLQRLFEKMKNGGEEWDAAIEKDRIQQEREQHLRSLKEAKRYSHKWFVAYMGYLDTFSEIEDTVQQKSLVFQWAEKHQINHRDSNRHFYLRNAAQLVPQSIEHFEDFEVTLEFNGKRRETIKVEGVSRKGQDLLVYSSQEVSPQLLKDLADVKKASIHFSPVLQLMKRLRTAFANKADIIPWNEINDVLPSLEFVYGPPGTGKTTLLVNRIKKHLKKGDGKRFLILTPTNKAADVLIDRLLTSAPETEACRLGFPTSPELEEEYPDLYQTSVDEELLQRVDVMASTVHRLPYFQAIHQDAPLKLFQLKNHWDYILFDEASMMDLPYIVFAIQALKVSHPEAHFIVSGDPKQLPPVIAAKDADLDAMEMADENIYKMMGINSFEEARKNNIPPHVITDLDTQHRSLESIGELFNQFSYDGLLQHGRKGQSAKPLPEDFQKLALQPLSFIHFPLNDEQSIYEPRKLVYSSYHLYSALLAAELVIHFDKCAEATAHEKWEIGLISPYKAHSVLLGKLLGAHEFSPYTKVHCDTVHGFQGDQCDIVLFSATPNNLKYTGYSNSLLAKNYLYNVAISRAQDYLWILHPAHEEGPGNPSINRLMSIAQQHNPKLDCRAAMVLEKTLFHKQNFIAENSYFTGHDPINLFGKSDQSYFIKANDRAIDIQLRHISKWSL